MIKWKLLWTFFCIILANADIWILAYLFHKWGNDDWRILPLLLSGVFIGIFLIACAIAPYALEQLDKEQPHD